MDNAIVVLYQLSYDPVYRFARFTGANRRQEYNLLLFFGQQKTFIYFKLISFQIQQNFPAAFFLQGGANGGLDFRQGEYFVHRDF